MRIIITGGTGLIGRALAALMLVLGLVFRKRLRVQDVT